MDLSLNGRNTIVCGSTQGIGKAIAIELANLGANVTIIARNEEKLQKTVRELKKISDKNFMYIAADFSNPEELSKKLSIYLRIHAPIHVLVNNTGGPPGGPIIDANLAEFQKAYTNHLLCNHLLTQAVAPGMKLAGYGRIINIISTSVKQPIDGLGVSNTTRGAVASWAKTLASELAPFKITVNNVLPGSTKTQRLSSLIEKQAQKLHVSTNEIEKRMLAQIPAKRFAEAKEIAYVVAFLASPAASYITGTSITVDGGRTKSL